MHNSPQSSASNKKHLKFILAAALTAVLTVSAFTIFAVNSAPPPSFTVPCQITTYGNAWTGDLTYGLYQFDPSNSNLTVASYLIIMDTEANLVRLREWPGSSYFGSVNYINPDLMLFQGEGGSSVNLWNLTTNAVTRYSNITGHHDAEYDPVNNTFLMLNNYVREVNGNKYLFDKIVQFNSTGSIIWTWDTYDHIPLSQQNIYNLTTTVNGETVIDFTHANTLDWHYNESIIYLNCRHTNTFYKINQTTGELIWSCGEFGNFTLLNAEGNAVKAIWFGCHDLREIEPNVFAMFNNDFGNITNFDDDHSAMQEVTIDTQNMTAWVSWSWTAPKELYSPYWGETARLPNGNRIGVFGTPNHPLATTSPYLVNDTGAVLVEVSPQSEVVRLYEFPYAWGIYRIAPTATEIGPTPSGTQTLPPTAAPAPYSFPAPAAYAILAVVVVAFMIIAIMLYNRRTKKT